MKAHSESILSRAWVAAIGVGVATVLCIAIECAAIAWLVVGLCR